MNEVPILIPLSRARLGGPNLEYEAVPVRKSPPLGNRVFTQVIKGLLLGGFCSVRREDQQLHSRSRAYGFALKVEAGVTMFGASLMLVTLGQMPSLVQQNRLAKIVGVRDIMTVFRHQVLQPSFFHVELTAYTDRTSIPDSASESHAHVLRFVGLTSFNLRKNQASVLEINV